MIDLVTYRARIGSYIHKVSVSKGHRENIYYDKKSKNMNWGYFMLILLMFSGLLISNQIYNVNCLSNIKGTSEMHRPQSKAVNWNKYMKSVNGNINTLTIGHLNAGSSYLGNSKKGKDKLNTISHLLKLIS